MMLFELNATSIARSKRWTGNRLLLRLQEHNIRVNRDGKCNAGGSDRRLESRSKPGEVSRWGAAPEA